MGLNANIGIQTKKLIESTWSRLVQQILTAPLNSSAHKNLYMTYQVSIYSDVTGRPYCIWLTWAKYLHTLSRDSLWDLQPVLGPWTGHKDTNKANSNQWRKDPTKTQKFGQSWARLYRWIKDLANTLITTRSRNLTNFLSVLPECWSVLPKYFIQPYQVH